MYGGTVTQQRPSSSRLRRTSGENRESVGVKHAVPFRVIQSLGDRSDLFEGRQVILHIPIFDGLTLLVDS